MNLDELLGQAPNRVIREVFGDGDTAFEVELRSCSRSDLDAMRKKATKRVLDKNTKQFKEELDVERLRDYLRDNCITGWSELTYAKVMALCNRTLPAGMQDLAQKAVEFTAENVTALIRDAIGFEEWVWDKVTARAEEVAQEDANSKKT